MTQPVRVPITGRVGTTRAERQRDALKELREVANKVGHRERTAGVYADLVTLTKECLEVGVRTKKIAETIANNASASRGIAARYIMMARWQLGRWKKTEKALQAPVDIAGVAYESPIAALESKTATFRQVFEAFSAAIRPHRARQIAPAKDAGEATKALVERSTIVLVGDKGPERIKVVERPTAFLAFMHNLLQQPIAKAVLGSQRVQAWDKAIEEEADKRSQGDGS